MHPLGEEVDALLGHHDALPVNVRVVGQESTERKAPEHSEWFTRKLTGAEKAERLLPFNPKRDRAVIMVIAGLAGNIVGTIQFGSANKVQNGQGGILQNGSTVTVEGSPEIWFAPDGVNSLWVTVIDERWE